MKAITLFLALILQAACVATSQEVCKDTNQQTQKVKRQPLPKSDFVLKSPTDYLKREQQKSVRNTFWICFLSFRKSGG